MKKSHGFRALAGTVVAVLGLLGAATAPAWAQDSEPLECMKRFKFKDFMIGGWWSVSSDPEVVRLYREAGFNLDMEANRGEIRKQVQLDVAEQLGIDVLLDTILAWPPGTPAHWATLDEIKALHNEYGNHPALVGYVINDNCALDERTVAVGQYMLEHAPEMICWVSMNPNPIAQAEVADALPILTSQNYPFLGPPVKDDTGRRIAFCTSLARDRDHCNRYNMCMWSFVNIQQAVPGAPVSPSEMRFQVYTSVAYGAQGVPYFYYYELARGEMPSPLFEAVKETNLYLRYVVGPRVLGHRCITVYHAPGEVPPGSREPGNGELLRSLDNDTLVGVLTPEANFVSGDNTPRYLMVVDKRTVNSEQREPKARAIELAFDSGVTTVTEWLPRDARVEHVLEGGGAIELSEVEAGGAILLEIGVAEHNFTVKPPEVTIVPLDPVWKFATDPERIGVDEGWYTVDQNDSDWAEVRHDQGTGWERQGFPGYTGIGWYRQTITPPESLDAKHLYLHFEAVDEEAWVYVNGEEVLDHSIAATGLGSMQIWSAPFAVDVADRLKLGEENVVAVRVNNVQGMGGVYVPVHLVASDEPLEVDVLTDLVLKHKASE